MHTVIFSPQASTRDGVVGLLLQAMDAENKGSGNSMTRRSCFVIAMESEESLWSNSNNRAVGVVISGTMKSKINAR